MRKADYSHCCEFFVLESQVARNFEGEAWWFWQNLTTKFSICIDMFMTPTQLACLGVTAHWIDDNWELVRVVLDLVRVTGPHTGENLTTYLTNILWELCATGKVSDFAIFACISYKSLFAATCSVLLRTMLQTMRP